MDRMKCRTLSAAILYMDCRGLMVFPKAELLFSMAVCVGDDSKFRKQSKCEGPTLVDVISSTRIEITCQCVPLDPYVLCVVTYHTRVSDISFSFAHFLMGVTLDVIETH